MTRLFSYGIVVDAGFSYTHVVPFVLGQPQTNCIRRIDVGGKLLTNYLKVLPRCSSLANFRALRLHRNVTASFSPLCRRPSPSATGT